MQTWLARTTWISNIGNEMKQREKDARNSLDIIGSMTQHPSKDAIDIFANYILPPTSVDAPSESRVEGRLLVDDLLTDHEFDQKFGAIYSQLIDYWTKIDDEAVDIFKEELECMGLHSYLNQLREATIGHYVSDQVPVGVLDAFQVAVLRDHVWQMWRFAKKKEELEMMMFLWVSMVGLDSKTTNFRNIGDCISTWESFEEMIYHYKKCMDMLEITSLGLTRKRAPTLSQLEDQRRRWFVWAETAVERSPKYCCDEVEDDDWLALPSDAEAANEI